MVKYFIICKRPLGNYFKARSALFLVSIRVYLDTFAAG